MESKGTKQKSLLHAWVACDINNETHSELFYFLAPRATTDGIDTDNTTRQFRHKLVVKSPFVQIKTFINWKQIARNFISQSDVAPAY